MATVGTEMSMSLDGFIAGPSGEVGPLFAWDGTGAVTVPMPDPRWTVRTSEASASHLRDGFTRIGVLVAGRRWFDATRGWGGNHPWAWRGSGAAPPPRAAGRARTPPSTS